MVLYQFGKIGLQKYFHVHISTLVTEQTALHHDHE